MPSAALPLLAIALAASAHAAPPALGDRACARAVAARAGDEAGLAIRCEASGARGGLRKPCGLRAFAGLMPARGAPGIRCSEARLPGGARALVTSLVAHVGPQLRPGDAADRCAASKLRAAARRARQGLACAGQAGAACLARARARLADAFDRLETRMACATRGDAAAVDGWIEGYAGALRALVAAALVSGSRAAAAR